MSDDLNALRGSAAIRGGGVIDGAMVKRERQEALAKVVRLAEEDQNFRKESIMSQKTKTPRTGRPPIVSATQHRIITMRKAGRSWSQIAEAVGVSRSSACIMHGRAIRTAEKLGQLAA